MYRTERQGKDVFSSYQGVWVDQEGSHYPTGRARPARRTGPTALKELKSRGLRIKLTLCILFSLLLSLRSQHFILNLIVCS